MPSGQTGDPGALRLVAPTSPAWQGSGSGSHRFYVCDDVLFWAAQGPMLVADFVTLYEQRAILQRQYGYALLLFDCRQHGGVPAESRRFLATQRSELSPIGSVVVFGASLLIRAAVSLIQGAARHLGRTQQTRLIFTGDEATSWQIVSAERLALRARASPSPQP